LLKRENMGWPWCEAGERGTQKYYARPGRERSEERHPDRSDRGPVAKWRDLLLLLGGKRSAPSGASRPRSG
jgi:hypothetical protein